MSKFNNSEFVNIMIERGFVHQITDKENLENEQERFNIGLSKTNDVLEAQTELIEAELAYNKSLADFNISLNEHKYSLGILLKDKKIILDN